MSFNVPTSPPNSDAALAAGILAVAAGQNKELRPVDTVVSITEAKPDTADVASEITATTERSAVDWVRVAQAQKKACLRDFGPDDQVVVGIRAPLTPSFYAYLVTVKWRTWVLRAMLTKKPDDVITHYAITDKYLRADAPKIAREFERMRLAAWQTGLACRQNIYGASLYPQPAAQVFWDAIKNLSLIMEHTGIPISDSEYRDAIVSGAKDGWRNVGDAIDWTADKAGKVAADALNKVGRAAGEGIGGLLSGIGVPGILAGAGILYVVVKGSPI